MRTVAIAEGPRRLLESVGAWEAIGPKAQAILSMEIMDGDVRDAVRLPHLHFDAKGGEPLAHMAFTDDVVAALSSVCARLGVERVAGAVARWSSGKRVAELSLADGRILRARLAVAADGARSKLRALAAIPAYGWDYDQSGIVATIAHERDHEGAAQQHFLPAGPFAVLPLPGRQSSIVWNERRADARALLALEPEDFLSQLELRFTPKLGDNPPRLAGWKPFRSASRSRAASSASGLRSSATPRISSIRSQARASIWACATSRRSPRRLSARCGSASTPARLGPLGDL